jgi:hypothetical protein
MTLTKGWPHMCVNLINGVIRVGWRDFLGEDSG